MNTYEIIGRLGADAELKQLGNWQVLTFNMAIDRSYYSKGKKERIEQTEWIKVNKFFPKDIKVKLIDYLGKGSLVLVDGIPKAEAWNDKEGNAKAMLSVSGDRIQLLAGAKLDQKPQATKEGETIAMDDDLPF